MRLAEVIARRPPLPRGLEPIGDPRSLSALNRALLVVDGTLTDLVEAHHLEPLELVKLGHRRRPLAAGLALLGVAPRGAVLERRILMRGRRSRAVRFVARTLFALDHLDPALARELAAGERPLGALLRAHAPGATKEILGAGRRRGALPAGLDPGADVAAGVASWAVRTYLLRREGRPLALVTEAQPEGRGEKAPGDRLYSAGRGR